MLLNTVTDVPAHAVELLAHSATFDITAEFDHAPHRLISTLYAGAKAHFRVLRLNCASPISFRQGDTMRAYDPAIMVELSV